MSGFDVAWLSGISATFVVFALGLAYVSMTSRKH